jgi:hypothetical protein
MTRHEPPGRELDLAGLPTDSRERHEVLLDLFGQYLMWIRNRTLKGTKKAAESEQFRNDLGTIRRKPYDGVGSMTAEMREAAFQFAEATVNEFISELLAVLAHQGVDFPLGHQHAVRLRLEMEIVAMETREVIHEEVINRGCERHFTNYWGRWLNRHRDK